MIMAFSKCQQLNSEKKKKRKTAERWVTVQRTLRQLHCYQPWSDVPPFKPNCQMLDGSLTLQKSTHPAKLKYDLGDWARNTLILPFTHHKSIIGSQALCYHDSHTSSGPNQIDLICLMSARKKKKKIQSENHKLFSRTHWREHHHC